MEPGQLNWIANFIWGIADNVLCDLYVRGKHRERRGGDQSLLNLSNVELAKALGAVEANGQARRIRVLGLLVFGEEEAELCCLGPNQAYRLLNSLEKRGLLVPRGEKKGRFYERGA